MTVLVLAFQNCAPVSFDAETRLVGKGEAGLSPIEDNYDYSDNNIDNPSVPPRSGDVYRALCNEAATREVTLGSEVRGIATDIILKTNDLKSVSGNAGRVVVINENPTPGTINTVHGNAGEVVICGFNVKVFAGTAGDVVLVNSHIEKVIGNSGHIRLVDSTIDVESGNAGELTTETLK